jgi:large conductance mechanosensitive channel
MPVIGRFTGGIDFTNLFIALAPIPANLPHTLDAMKKAGVPVIAYGNFINIVFNFVILAFVVFLMVKQINRVRREAPKARPHRPRTCSCCAKSAIPWRARGKGEARCGYNPQL